LSGHRVAGWHENLSGRFSIALEMSTDLNAHESVCHFLRSYQHSHFPCGEFQGFQEHLGARVLFQVILIQIANQRPSVLRCVVLNSPLKFAYHRLQELLHFDGFGSPLSSRQAGRGSVASGCFEFFCHLDLEFLEQDSRCKRANGRRRGALRRGALNRRQIVCYGKGLNGYEQEQL
jgi:hypothetical protein